MLHGWAFDTMLGSGSRGIDLSPDTNRLPFNILHQLQARVTKTKFRQSFIQLPNTKTEFKTSIECSKSIYERKIIYS